MFDGVVLEVKGLEKRYGSFGLRMSFHLAPGEVLGGVGSRLAAIALVLDCGECIECLT